MAAHANGRHIGLGALVVRAGPEYAESVVVRALEFRGSASTGARGALNRALDSYVRVNGFRDASRAPSGPLKTPTLDALTDENAAFARALFGVWAESMPDLRDAVREYLEGGGKAAGSPDPDGRPWSAGELEEAVNEVLGRHEGLYEPDIALMLSFLSGRSLHVDDQVVEIRSPLMLDFLAELEGLEFNAPDWDEVDDFLDEVTRLEDERLDRITSRIRESIAASVDDLLQEFETELIYLDLRDNIAGWAGQAIERLWQYGDMAPIIDELRQRLGEYQPLRPQAETRAEETGRAVQRVAAEDGILELADRWRELLSQPAPVLEADRDDDPGAGPGASVDAAVRMEEIEELRAKLEGVHRNYEELRAEIERVAGQRDALAAERDSLQEEIGRLDDELSSSRETVRIWRLAGVSARMEEAGLPASGQTEPRTVRDAVARAEKLFPDRLAVALNSKSDKRSPFQKPQEVFDALAWLATDYHHRRANPGGSPDFDKLLKEACPGWSYKSSQTEITREQFEQWYTTTWDGRSYDLSPHLGKGISHDPQNTIRIAFAWDEDRKRVVVGYIGMHQRNRKS